MGPLRRGLGLSPRVRGNPPHPADHAAPDRSIPACAGEPQTLRRKNCGPRVYPRVCGGTTSPRPNTRPAMGLSPRVRGNRHCQIRAGTGTGSIPACAGEPSTHLESTRWYWVYPRVCGGTDGASYREGYRQGLSPRVRGNRIIGLVNLARDRSIPACAGEPSPGRPDWQTPPVYPRVCGGTTYSAVSNPRVVGLSPRVRGNQCNGATSAIPNRVYPRVCGGTRVVPAF